MHLPERSSFNYTVSGLLELTKVAGCGHRTH